MNPSLIQSFSPSILQSFSPSVLQSFSPSVLQSFSPSVLQSFSPSVLQSFSPSVLQSFSPSVLQSFSPSVLQSFSPSVLQSFSPSVLQSFSPSVLQSFSPSILHSFTPSPPSLPIAAPGELSYERVRDARRKIWIYVLKKTNVGVTRASLDLTKYHLKRNRFVYLPLFMKGPARTCRPHSRTREISRKRIRRHFFDYYSSVP